MQSMLTLHRLGFLSRLGFPIATVPICGTDIRTQIGIRVRVRVSCTLQFEFEFEFAATDEMSVSSGLRRNSNNKLVLESEQINNTAYPAM